MPTPRAPSSSSSSSSSPRSRSEAPWRPTKAQLAAATQKRVRDVARPGLDVLFCGINPGRYSAAVGHHFAGPGNLFWPTLFTSGFTPRRFTAFEDSDLLALGLGITNFVARASATAAELTPAEFRAGARQVVRKVHRLRPRFIAFLGLGAYRIAFDQPRAQVGPQPSIGPTAAWLLPNPSGLNAHHGPAILRQMFSDLLRAVRSTPP